MVAAAILLPLFAAAPAGATTEGLTCAGQQATIVGTDGADRIVGTDGDDVIVARGGNDIILAGEGEDLVCGGPGNDRIRGQQQSDVIYGEAGDDIIFGNWGADVIYGGDGDDRIDGGFGDDTVYGDAGDNWLRGGNHTDVVFGGPGDDDMGGGNGHDLLEGFAGDDILRGGGGHDTLNGGLHRDIINSGTGNDFINGGSGNDDLRSGGTTLDVVSGGHGLDTLDGESIEDVVLTAEHFEAQVRDEFYRSLNCARTGDYVNWCEEGDMDSSFLTAEQLEGLEVPLLRGPDHQAQAASAEGAEAVEWIPEVHEPGVYFEFRAYSAVLDWKLTEAESTELVRQLYELYGERAHSTIYSKFLGFEEFDSSVGIGASVSEDGRRVSIAFHIQPWGAERIPAAS